MLKKKKKKPFLSDISEVDVKKKKKEKLGTAEPVSLWFYRNYI